MSHILYIAEKPSVARAIAAELGVLRREEGALVCRGNTVVTWCFGHLLEQAEPDAYLTATPATKSGKKAWRLEDLPILPKTWKMLPKKEKGAAAQLAKIGKLLKDASMVVHAGDPDREGQLLVDEVLEHFRTRLPVKRFWVSAVDPASIRKGLANLRENRNYAGMRDAARGRSRADWLLGMNLSRVYTLTNPGPAAEDVSASSGSSSAPSSYGSSYGTRGRGTSTRAGRSGRVGGGSRFSKGRTRASSNLIAVGRVQTPALAMVARRDYAVRHFVPVPFWRMAADLEKRGIVFRAVWKPAPGQPGMDDEGKRLIDIDRGRALCERLKTEREARVISAATKRKKAYPPKAYTLADIQIEANRLYGFGADETLSVCQALYEKHKVASYPRTDCGYLPRSQHADAPRVLDAIAETCPAAAKAVAAANPVLVSPTFNDSKVTAHHGIVPVANAVAPSALSEKEKKIYRLIARRYVAQFFPVHEYDETTAEFAVGGETFAAKGRVVTVRGWKALFEKPEKTSSASAEATKSSRAKTTETDETEADASGTKSDEERYAKQRLPELAKGELVPIRELIGTESQTEPPAFFTEGTLIAAMENIWRSFDDPHIQAKLKEAGGIGTPATRAAIIKELQRKGYLVAEGKHLHCTPEGRNVLLQASPKVRSAAMTAAFETKLALVEAGEYALNAFVAEFEAFVAEEVKRRKGE